MSEARAEQRAFGWAEQVAEPRLVEGAAPEAPPGEPRAVRAHCDRQAGVAVSARAAAPKASSGRKLDAPLPPDDELWDVRAAARFLKRSVSWVYHKVEDGTLPVRRLAGWGIRFIPGELRAWVTSADTGRGLR
jgi:predicted DNA-binding transcriptional regulator AlpA